MISSTVARRLPASALLTAALLAPAAHASPAVPAPEGTASILAPGLTHQELVWQLPTATETWTVQLTVPSSDPAVASGPIGGRADAQALADRLTAQGFTARVESVHSTPTVDAGGDLGFRVRVGEFTTRTEADQTRSRLVALGHGAAVWLTEWDGPTGAPVTGQAPADVHVLTVDPRRFKGTVDASFGPDLARTETTSFLGADALAAVNGGFFVFGSEHGAPGDPAGVGAYDGRILSESVGIRPALVIDHRHGRARVERLQWSGEITSRGATVSLDGLNRVPGKIRNCGGDDDAPTDAPVHDVTCTDADEVVAFTAEFGERTPTGEGVEVVLSRTGHVLQVRDERGTVLEEGQMSVQATGAAVDRLMGLGLRDGRRLRFDQRYLQENGHALRMTPHTQVLNGGPQLVRDGRIKVTAARDGMDQAGSPGFYYGWVHQRNPRTIAGVDAQGRLIVATVDGRLEDSAGMSITEAAELARSLGMVDAVNLDGGGSTTMVMGGAVVNTPSGGAERAVGDALVFRAR